MTALLAYLIVGVANYAQFAVRGRSLLFSRPKRRGGDARAAGLAEAVFFVLAWPVQLAFWLGVKTLELRDWIHEKAGLR